MYSTNKTVNMNNYFSFSRWWLLVRKQWGENAKLYLLGMLAILGLMAFGFFLWVVSHGRSEKYQEVTLYFLGLIGLFLTGAVFASMLFSSLSQRDKAIHWLGAPATHLEKLCCALFYSVIVFNGFYLLSFFLVKAAGFAILRTNPAHTIIEIQSFREKTTILVRYLFTIYIAVQALYLLGSVYFSRYSFVKTTVLGLLLIIIFILYVNMLQRSFLHGGSLWSFTSFQIWDEKGGRLYQLPDWVDIPVKFFLQYAWAPVFWLATWYRLKEKQI